MKAVILAAGIGSRLRDITKDKPKCLLKIKDNLTIIEYQIRVLKEIANIQYKDIFVIGGHKFEKLSFLKKYGINIIFNPKYSQYNNIYSFYMAKQYITEDFILVNGDTLFHPKILKLLVKTDIGTYFVIDNIKKLGEEEMKVIIRDNRIMRFGKDINPENSQGEYIGLARFSWSDAKIIFEKMEELIESGKTNIWYELAINYVLDKILARPIYTNGLPWIEIDTPEDYKKAKAMAEVIIVDI
ncbi:phosphocholine cytidylyltransferase family protein [Pyrococcus kukulkanii]|uniref:Phosphocholine cytidylyltransferase family protein n=1 Tax=Pyrococcus kukulkanii TaxID=1609559 RepID=A0ABV4T810_9EURY